MSTEVEAVPDWVEGYALSLPCGIKIPPCDNEAEWFGNQHGCVRAYICDLHMQQCYTSVSEAIAEFGNVQCRVCNRLFISFAQFIKAVRI